MPEPEFSRGFAGLTDTPVSLDELLQARDDLIGAIVGGMPTDHRRFLMTVKRGQPEWTLLDLPGAEALPAVRWRLENLAKLDGKKRAAFVARLGEVLGIGD